MTFRSGTTVLGTAPVVKQGSTHWATLVVPATLKVGTYGALTATLSADGKTVTSATAAGSFKVVKAKLATLKVKAPKKAKKGKKTSVKVSASKLLTSKAAASGKVVVYVGKKKVKTLTVAQIAKKRGTVKVTIAKKYVKGKSLTVKATFTPAAAAKAGVESSSATAKIAVKK